MKVPKIFIAIFLTTLVVIIVFAVTTSAQDVNQKQPTDPMHAGNTQYLAQNDNIFDTLIGKKAPDFELESYNGTKIKLSSLKGKNVVLFFNEGVMCYPACWNQIAALGADKQLNNENTVAISISVDAKSDWTQAVNKMPELAQATVLFDTSREVSDLYGVLNLPSSMHKGQNAGHTYVIVDKEGVVRYTKDDLSMGVRNDELKSEIAKLN